MDADCNDADGNEDNPDNRDWIPSRLALCASFDRIRKFVLSHTLLFCNNGGKVCGGGTTKNVVCPVWCTRLNLNPMCASNMRRRGGGRRGRQRRQRRRQLDTRVCRDVNWMLESLYPCKGNCQMFVPALTGRPCWTCCSPHAMRKTAGSAHITREGQLPRRTTGALANDNSPSSCLCP